MRKASGTSLKYLYILMLYIYSPNWPIFGKSISLSGKWHFLCAFSSLNILLWTSLQVGMVVLPPCKVGLLSPGNSHVKGAFRDSSILFLCYSSTDIHEKSLFSKFQLIRTFNLRVTRVIVCICMVP